MLVVLYLLFVVACFDLVGLWCWVWRMCATLLGLLC